MTRDTSISAFVTERLESYRDRTILWGTPKTVEVLALQLLELECRELYPVQYEANPRMAIDLYVRELAKATGDAIPLHKATSRKAFGTRLFAVCQLVRRRLRKRHAIAPPAIPVAAPPVMPALTWRRTSPSVDITASVERSVANVRRDAQGDWLRDPWGWPELIDQTAASAAALELLTSRQFTAPMTLDVAKSRTATRPALQLAPIDRVAYQAVVDALALEVTSSLSPNVFGWRPARSDPKPGAYNNNSTEWKRHRSFRRRMTAAHKYVLHLDVRDFFEGVNVERLLSSLPHPHALALEPMFEFWRTSTPRRGLPQRCLASSVLAHAYLRSADDELLSNDRVRWCRWMDDFTIASNDYSSLADCLVRLEQRLGELGLSINAAKTHITDAKPLEVDLSGIDFFAVPFRSGPIHQPRLVEATNALVASEDPVSRSDIAFVARRIRLVRDGELAERLLGLSERSPFAADCLARMARELALGSARADWYLQYARVRPGASDWTVAAWALMFAAGDRAPASVRAFFAERLAYAGPGAVLVPTAASHVADLADGIELLNARLRKGHAPQERRALLLAKAQAGHASSLDVAGSVVLHKAIERVRRGDRAWDFREVSA